MWEPKGKIIESSLIGSLEPVEPLFEFEGEYLTFVAHDPNDDLLLVHNLCVSDGVSRYLVSPIDLRILGDLKAGRLDIYSALRQPRCWIADLVPADAAQPPWRFHALYRIDFDSVPKDHLPRPGTMITPDLDPIFRLRLIGSGVGPGNTTAADIRMAAQAAESGLRGLARIALYEKKQVGQVRRNIRDYSDLPFQYTRAASFEIAFSRPRNRLPGLDDEVFDEMGRLLKEGLGVLRTNGDDLVPIEGLSEDQSAQLFQAIKALTPPMRGGVERVEVGGGLTDGMTGSKILTRDDRLRSLQRVKASRKIPVKEAPFRVTGVAENADQGFDFFILRQLVPSDIPDVGPVSEIKFSFDDHLFDRVSEAWNSQERVTVVGERIGNDFKALDIQESTLVPPLSQDTEPI
jgi:hypothetical protein